MRILKNKENKGCRHLLLVDDNLWKRRDLSIHFSDTNSFVSYTLLRSSCVIFLRMKRAFKCCSSSSNLWPNLCTAGNFYFLTIELAREKWLLSKGVFPGAIIRGIRTSLVDRYLFYKKKSITFDEERESPRSDQIVFIPFLFLYLSFVLRR